MATLGKEIVVSAENKVGTLFKVTAPLKEAEVNVRALSAWGEGGKATLWVVTDNNDKAEQALKKAGWSCQQKEVVLAELANRVGTIAEAAQKISGAGVDIEHFYISASGPQALAVIATKDNAKALKALG